MSDYIKRSDAVKTLRMIKNCVDIFSQSIDDAASAVDDLATKADVRENVHGQWEENDVGFFRCSVCKKECLFLRDFNTPKAYAYLSKFCPFCGAELEVNEMLDEEDSE